MYKEEYYDYSSKEGKMIKNDLKSWGLHHLTISSLPADFFRMSKSQLEKLFERASDAFIARMYDVPQYQVEKRRGDFGIKQLRCTLNRMEREEETAQIFKEILRIVSNEYNNGNFPHTNSTPLNSEKEFLYMKATGIVRRIDELGRIVIPKEIRRTLRLREGDPVEIYTGENGEIVLRKHSVMGDLNEFALQFADSLAKTAGYPTCITDRDSVVAVSGVSKKDFSGKRITRQLEQAMEDRTTFIAPDRRTDFFPILEDINGDKMMSFVGTPIISNGDPVGSVIMFSPDNGKAIGDTEAKLTQSAAAVLGKQLEQ